MIEDYLTNRLYFSYKIQILSFFQFWKNQNEKGYMSNIKFR